jgi:GT2 family glycosyltransferase
MTTPSVAVLILNWNGWQDTVECLESVFRSDYPADRLCVLVCDNGSTDGSADHIMAWARGNEPAAVTAPEPIRHCVEPPVAKPILSSRIQHREMSTKSAGLVWGGLTLLETGDNLGFAGGNNVGLSFLLGQHDVDYVLIMNNDIVIDRNCVAEFVKTSRSVGSNAVVGGTLFEYGKPEQLQAVAGGRFRMWQALSQPYLKPPKGDPVNFKLDYVSGGFMLAPRDMLERAGPIREDYFLYGEDVDFSLRLRRLGAKLAATLDARGWHKGGASVGHRSPLHDYYTVRNGLAVVRRNSPGFVPVSTAYVLLRCGLPKIARGEWTRLAILRRAYRDFAAGTMGRASSLPTSE